MSYIEKIIKAADIIKGNFEEHFIDLGKEDRQFDRKYGEFREKSGIVFTDELCELYRKNSDIKISWARRKSMENLFGCFELIPLENIIPMHENMLEMSGAALEYAETEEEKLNGERLRILNFMYPVLDFKSGDALCVHGETGQIVLFDHDVFELGGWDINGLVIADSYDMLIDRWSSILFVEGIWRECVNDEGIDLGSEFSKAFCGEFS